MTGRVVVVTGGTAGAGRAIARAFADRGDAVAVLARGQDGLDGTLADLQARGVRALAVRCDVGDAAQVDDAAERVERELGPIDVWVNNAMAGSLAPFLELSPAEFEQVTRTTYLGSVNGTRAALRAMVPRDRGRIVQVGSALAFRGIPLQSAYCGAKHAIEGFLDSVRTELVHERSKVRVTQVHMPALNTPQFGMVLNRMGRHGQPVPPIYQPEVAARGVVWAAEHRRREVWLGAPTVGTILGNRLVPGLLDRYLGRTGYASQLTDAVPYDQDSPHYLFEPVPGDKGAHGAFDDTAWSASPVAALSRHRPAVTAAVLAAGVVGGRALVERLRRPASPWRTFVTGDRR